jgi:3-dehydroquinate dehydratase-1
MKRRTMIQSGIGGLAAAFSASVFASTKLKGNEKMIPVDTLNHEPGWDKEPVEVLEIKGVRIGEGRPKIIASTTAKTPEAFIALVKDYNSRPELQMIELRPDYIGEISGKEFAKLTKQVYEIAKNKPILMTFRDKTEGGGRHVCDEYYRDVVVTLTGSLMPLSGFAPTDAPYNLAYAIANSEFNHPEIYVSIKGKVYPAKEKIVLHS